MSKGDRLMDAGILSAEDFDGRGARGQTLVSNRQLALCAALVTLGRNGPLPILDAAEQYLAWLESGE